MLTLDQTGMFCAHERPVVPEPLPVYPAGQDGTHAVPFRRYCEFLHRVQTVDETSAENVFLVQRPQLLMLHEHAVPLSSATSFTHTDPFFTKLRPDVALLAALG